jgi:hypothetical protein
MYPACYRLAGSPSVLQPFKHTRSTRQTITTVPRGSQRFLYIPNSSHMFPSVRRNRYQSLAKKGTIAVLDDTKKVRAGYSLLKPY